MKTILLTGASGDIGSAIVTKLTADGYRVIGVTHSDSSAEKVRSLHGIDTFVADLGKRDDIMRLGKEVTEPFEWLVTAHGYIDTELDFMQATPEHIETTFRVNALSQIYLAQAFLPRLSRGMVMISSTAGVSANGRTLAYSASKAGVNALAQGLARNKSEQTFIALCPGPTKGSMRDKIGAEGGQEPSLVADALVRIIADGSEYMSGDIVSVKDGAVKIESRIV
jgi:NAD(P)-dependent dehydrogenase (short-subunit alcohol dehydrogenase family)